MRSEEQLRKEVSATLKMILLEMEELAALPPVVACSPDEFNERRRKVVRKIWQLYKDTINYGLHDASQDH